MKRVFTFIFILIMAAAISGCSSLSMAPESHEPALVAWNYIIYGLSIEKLPQDTLEFEIGQIAEQVEGFPESNGESNLVPAGAKLYKIKDKHLFEAIAIHMDGEYYKAYSNGTLQVQ